MKSYLLFLWAERIFYFHSFRMQIVRASAAATNFKKVAQRFREGRVKAARRPAIDSEMAARRPIKRAMRQPESRYNASKRSP